MSMTDPAPAHGASDVESPITAVDSTVFLNQATEDVTTTAREQSHGGDNSEDSETSGNDDQETRTSCTANTKNTSGAVGREGVVARQLPSLVDLERRVLMKTNSRETTAEAAAESLEVKQPRGTSTSEGVPAITRRKERNNESLAQALLASTTNSTAESPGAFHVMGGMDLRLSNVSSVDENSDEDSQQSAPPQDAELAQAIPVEELEATDSPRAPAFWVSNSLQEGRSRQNALPKREQLVQCATIGLFFTVLLVAVLVPVFLLERGSSNGTTASTASTTTMTTGKTTLSMDIHMRSLLPAFTILALEDPDSPQAQAFHWIMEVPHLMTYPDERLLQRFALGCLYHSTNGDRWTNNTNWLSHHVHECHWYSRDFGAFYRTGLYDELPAPYHKALRPLLNESFPCGDPTKQMYTHLWLFNNNLNGYLPPEIYLLTTLKRIRLGPSLMAGSELSTEIGRLSLLEGLAMASSGVTGTLPTQLGLLTNLDSLFLPNNNLVGEIPMVEFKRESATGQPYSRIVFVDQFVASWSSSQLPLWIHTKRADAASKIGNGGNGTTAIGGFPSK